MQWYASEFYKLKFDRNLEETYLSELSSEFNNKVQFRVHLYQDVSLTNARNKIKPNDNYFSKIFLVFVLCFAVHQTFRPVR